MVIQDKIYRGRIWSIKPRIQQCLLEGKLIRKTVCPTGETCPDRTAVCENLLDFRIFNGNALVGNNAAVRVKRGWDYPSGRAIIVKNHPLISEAVPGAYKQCSAPCSLSRRIAMGVVIACGIYWNSFLWPVDDFLDAGTWANACFLKESRDKRVGSGLGNLGSICVCFPFKRGGAASGITDIGHKTQGGGIEIRIAETGKCLS